MFKIILSVMVSLLFLMTKATSAAEAVQQTPQQLKLNTLKIELGGHLFHQVATDPTDIHMFNKIYGGRMTAENLLDVMKIYTQSQVTASRFDDYLSGDKSALTSEEIHGYDLFKSYGCAACHNGANLGGTQFKKMGTAKNYFMEHRTVIKPADLGLFEVTKKVKDLSVFKVPSLRNIAIMGPYYHDGSVESLDGAVSLMGKYQLGITIPENDIKAIVAFLKSLTAKSLSRSD
jgi:cytochrome c peroxidase